MRYLLSILLLSGMGGCQLIEPKEQAATIYWDAQLACVCCGGWRIQIGSTKLRALKIPDAYATKDSANVWVRYKDDESKCGKMMPDLVLITSMRSR